MERETIYLQQAELTLSGSKMLLIAKKSIRKKKGINGNVKISCAKIAVLHSNKILSKSLTVEGINPKFL